MQIPLSLVVLKVKANGNSKRMLKKLVIALIFIVLSALSPVFGEEFDRKFLICQYDRQNEFDPVGKWVDGLVFDRTDMRIGRFKSIYFDQKTERYDKGPSFSNSGNFRSKNASLTANYIRWRSESYSYVLDRKTLKLTQRRNEGGNKILWIAECNVYENEEAINEAWDQLVTDKQEAYDLEVKGNKI